MSIFKAHIHQMSAYKPPLDGRDPSTHLLLDFNERTLPVSKAVEDALVSYIRAGRLQMYPAYGDTCRLIADYCQVPEQQVMLTNGSDQGIDLVIRSACREGDEAIIPGPSFAMYTQVAKVENLSIIEPQYSKDRGFPTDEVLAAVTERTKVVCIANPNNPSGTVVSRSDILRIAKAAPHAAILVDECYFEYVGETVADAVSAHPNLVITRTFSKTWGIPSLRLGYVISNEDNILALLNVRGPYDINQLAVVAIRTALAHQQDVRAYVAEVMTESKPLLEACLEALGIDYWPSGANFLWTFPMEHERLYQAFLEENILVRPKKDASGKTGLRISIGTVEQTKTLMSVLRRCVSGS